MDFPTLAVLVFGGLLYGFWRAGELHVTQTLFAVLLGFFLADSAIAPNVNEAVHVVFDWVATWRI